MKALILAAGKGTRLAPLTLDLPKPMLPIGEKPLLEHLVRWLLRHGIAEIAVNLHHKPEIITGYLGNGRHLGANITYSRERELLGTAGAAKNLQSFLDETFVVMYGDVYTNFDLTRLIRYHNSLRSQSRFSSCFLTMVLYRVHNPSACGLVEINEQGQVTRFVEKPPPDLVFTDLANAGVLVLEPGILNYIPPNMRYDFGLDLFPKLLRLGIPLYGYPLRDDEFLIDIGTLESYQEAQKLNAVHV
jgi:NDP-sugar pyrophosphorylase family protein